MKCIGGCGMPEDLCACDQSAAVDLDAWRAEAGEAARAVGCMTDTPLGTAARTGWPRDAARVGVLADRCAGLEARVATLSALVAAGDRMEALAERFAARCEAWRTYALAVNVLRLSEGCVEEEEYARLHEEHDRAWQAVLAVEPEAAKR